MSSPIPFSSDSTPIDVTDVSISSTPSSSTPVEPTSSVSSTVLSSSSTERKERGSSSDSLLYTVRDITSETKGIDKETALKNLNAMRGQAVEDRSKTKRNYLIALAVAVALTVVGIFTLGVVPALVALAFIGVYGAASYSDRMHTLNKLEGHREDLQTLLKSTDEKKKSEREEYFTYINKWKFKDEVKEDTGKRTSAIAGDVDMYRLWKLSNLKQKIHALDEYQENNLLIDPKDDDLLGQTITLLDRDMYRSQLGPSLARVLIKETMKQLKDNLKERYELSFDEKSSKEKEPDASIDVS